MAEADRQTSALFSPLKISGTVFKNRIVISPMCTYSAEEGLASDWHLAHLGQYAPVSYTHLTLPTIYSV